ncbi:MAG: ATPase, T2SS/T4P/T4SS family [Planctomycetota bacterium]|nr:ATPase, T2SS/T4P/T4SS family [Planctomycetota bacterium]
MAPVNEKFALALKSRLDGRFEEALQNGPLDSPGRARLAGIDGDVVAGATADALGLPYLESLAGLAPDAGFLARVPIAFARRHGVLGLAGKDGVALAAIADLAQWLQVQVLGKVLGGVLVPVLAPRAEILRAIGAAYELQTGQAQRVIEQLDEAQVLREVNEAVRSEDLLDVASRAPVIKLVNLVLFEAVKRRASDVHIQPLEDRLAVRFRLDGVLYDVFDPPRALHPEIVSRIKVMGGMNIAEQRLAQDGRATVEVGHRVVDLRIATLPTHLGERVVIRLLDKSARLYTLDELGMAPHVLVEFRRLIHTDHGIILVAGPTGSGKTTTLYAALQEINAKELNILTLEDPIEYRLEGISQTQVSDKKGMTFASGLRHVLRQDPDIIMVGEIRDAETARMAIQSALTGHLVFSTLHTNDAAGAVARLLDLGAEPYLMASSLLAVLAQRLVRRVCTQCRTAHDIAEEEHHEWSRVAGQRELPERLYHGSGCEACLGTGYRERVGVFELLTVTEPIQELVLGHAKSSSIKAAALAEGMTTLRADGLAKAVVGATTLEEVVRVTGRDEF